MLSLISHPPCCHCYCYVVSCSCCSFLCYPVLFSFTQPVFVYVVLYHCHTERILAIAFYVCVEYFLLTLATHSTPHMLRPPLLQCLYRLSYILFSPLAFYHVY